MKSKSRVENESRRCPGVQDDVRVAWGPGFGWVTGMAGAGGERSVTGGESPAR